MSTQIVVDEITAELHADIIEVVELGVQGLPGTGGGSSTITGIAATALSGHRVVAPAPDGRMEYASNDSANAFAAIGITLNAATANDVVQIATEGIVEESSWAWVPGATIYLGTAGMLTQVPPASGISRQIGIALSPTRILLQIQSGTILL